MRKLLTENELQSWMAPYDIPAGAKYAHRIDQAIANCECVLLLLTKEAQESNHVEREMDRALDYKKEIVPVCLDGCTLNPGFRYYIGSCQISYITSVKQENPAVQAVMERLLQLCPVETDAFRLFMEHIGHWMELPKKYIIDRERMQLLESLYGQLVDLLQAEDYTEADYTICIEPDALDMGDAAISLEMDEIIVQNIDKLCQILRNFDNLEIYPLVDNRLRFSGMFRKVAKVIRQP